MASRSSSIPPGATQPRSRRSWISNLLRPWTVLLVGAMVVVLFGAAFAIAQKASNDEVPGLVFTIPRGASRTIAIPTIDSAIEVPTDIRFGPGETARITVRNNDDVANRAGPWVVGPGQTYTAAFDQPGVYQFDCAVDESESVTVTVSDG